MNGAASLSLDASQARLLTDRIKATVEDVWNLITEAYLSRAWVALSYSSWDEYCTQEFRTSRIRLPREERQEVVASLRESGLSIRAIEAATGESRSTVQRTVSSPVPNGTPGVDSEFAVAAKGQDPELVQLLEGLVSGVEPRFKSSVKPMKKPVPKVTGVDGKRYTTVPKAAATKPVRGPLVDTAGKVGWELRRVVNRLEGIAQDDRLSDNKGKVAVQLSGQLAYAMEVCQDLIERLNEKP